MKKRLGRGLSAILEDVEEAYKKDIKSDSSIIQKIPLTKIVPNKYQPRKNFDEESLKSLSESIKQHGILQPIVVVKQKNKYMIVAGERRYRAAKMAGFESIDAVVADFEEKNFRELALIENIQREDLSPIELAHSYKELINEYSITQEELSSIIHKSRSHIANTMRLLNLSKDTQQLISEGKITQGHAKVLVGLDKKSEKMIVDTIIKQKLNVRDTEDLIKKLKDKTNKNSTKIVTKEKKEIFDTIDSITKKIESLGFKVKNSGNKITINFDTKEKTLKFLSYFNKNS